MKRTGNWLLAASALVVLSACGSSGAATGTGASGGIQVALDAQNFQFTPSTVTVKPGDRVTVTVSNKDTIEHNFSITELHVNQDISAATSKSVTFTATSSNLQFFCEYHKSKGMVGTLDVGGANAVPSAPAAKPSSSDYTKYPAY